MDRLTGKIGIVGSESRLMVGDNPVNAQRVEVISQAGKPTQAILYCSPGWLNIDVATWKVDSEMAKQLAEAIANRLGAGPFVSEIYDEIIKFVGDNDAKD